MDMGKHAPLSTRAAIIAAHGLVKRYGQFTAVDHVDLTVYAGEIFGILGPNGAGKTTTLEMIEGLRVPDEGAITVAGIDALRHPKQVKRRIGVQLQTTALFDYLTVRELIGLFASLYASPASDEKIDEIVRLVSLDEKADATADTLSGGQQQRLSIALALVNDPDIIFLDEPTTGLDPQARRNLWDVVEMIRDSGTTVVLTTHYMEEAEILCDRVAVMDHGRVILCDTPAGLISRLEAAAVIEARVAGDGMVPDDFRSLPGVLEVDVTRETITLKSGALQQTMVSLIELAQARGIEIENLATTRPTLEDVFLHYTGRTLRE
jgi:ABC-2 type transport system ATP-binding protein